jgi:hypothetical protein
LKLELDKRFLDKAKGRFQRYEFEVGVLEDMPYQKPEPKSKGLKKFLGGPARRVSRKSSGLTVARVSFYNRRKTDYFRAPFKRKSSDIIRFSKEFFKLLAGQSEERRVLNYLQAIVRNPILRGDYGPNMPSTIRRKGFDRYMIDTGQLFNSIKARVSRVRK